MPVPSYYPARGGRVYRIRRAHERAGPDGQSDATRYVLRAFLVSVHTADDRRDAPAAEVAEEASAQDVLERLRRRQAVPTPEERFESLWQRLRLELDGL